MDYKRIFHIVTLLISSPTKAWEEICAEKRQDVAFNYVYPLIGLAALSVFIGALIDRGIGGPESYQYAMARCCSVVIAYFGGFYLSAYLTNQLRIRMYGQEDDMQLCMMFSGYCLTVPMVLQVITGLLPDLGIISMLLQLYIIYLVWTGSSTLMHVADDKRLTFTVIVSIMLMACHSLIGGLFDMFEMSV